MSLGECEPVARDNVDPRDESPHLTPLAAPSPGRPVFPSNNGRPRANGTAAKSCPHALSLTRARVGRPTGGYSTHILSTRTLSALAYDRGEDYDPCASERP